MFISRSFKTITRNRAFENIVKRADVYKQKFSGTIIEKWMKYWQNLCIDYKEVVLDVAKESKQKPFKAVSIISGLTFLAIFGRNNPDETSFRDAVLKSACDVLLLSSIVQRKESVEHLRMIEKCYNFHSIRRLNLGIVSLMWADEFSSKCNTYECNCDYLQVPFTGIYNRVIDIGFMNKWWLLDKHMEDYDVNY